MLYLVRFYQDIMHPDAFSKGWRGKWIVLLNWMRWRLETYVQKQVLQYLAKEGAVSKPKVRELLKSFRLDVAGEELDKERTSPQNAAPLPDNVVPISRAERYFAPASLKALKDVAAEHAPMRPQPLNEMISKYAFPGRAQRYAHRKGWWGDPDGNFEPLENQE